MKIRLMRYILLFLNSTYGRKLANALLDKVTLIFWNITLGRTSELVLHVRRYTCKRYTLGLDLDDTDTTQQPEKKQTAKRVVFIPKRKYRTSKHRVLTNMVSCDVLATQLPLRRVRRKKKTE